MMWIFQSAPNCCLSATSHRMDLFIDLFTSYRPQRLAQVVEKYFGGNPSVSQGSNGSVTSSTLQPDQLADFYGQLQGFLREESHAAQSLFGQQAVSSLMCLLLEKIMLPLAGPMRARYSPTAYPIVEKFTSRIAPLLVGSGEADLLRSLRACYSTFLDKRDVLIDYESHALQGDLETILDEVHFDTRPVSSTAGGLSILSGDEVTAGEGPDLQLFDSDDISAVFESYAASLCKAVDKTYRSFAESILRSVGFMGGLPARQYVRFLSPVLSQHIKTLLLRVDLLRVAGSMPLQNPADVSYSHSTEEQQAEAARIAKEFRMSDMGISKGKVLLQCALRVFLSAGALCRHFTSLEQLAAEQLDIVYQNLFTEGSSVSLVVRMLASGNADTAVTSVGGAVAAAILKEDATAESELRAFLTAVSRRTTSSVAQGVLSSSLVPLGKFKQAAERFLFDLATHAPQAHLQELHSDELWVAEGEVSEDQQEQMLPQQAFTQVTWTTPTANEWTCNAHLSPLFCC